MVGRSLSCVLVCGSLLAAGAVLAYTQEVSRSTSTSRADSVVIADEKASASPVASEDPSGLRQKIETPMATAERLETEDWWPTKHSVSRQDFVGTAECARCHAKRTVTQLTTPMARASTLASSSSVLREHERISRKVGVYTYAISSSREEAIYSVSEDGKSISEPLHWAFGVNQKGQTYIYQRNGAYYEGRMSFFKSLQGLDLTPGHDPQTPANREDAMGRLLAPSTLRLCFGCHTTAATTTAGFDPLHLMPGITCEACHGPGAEHVALMEDEKTEAGRRAIFNPKDLNPVALVDFCGACHRTMNDVVEMASTGVETVRFQPYRLESSRCWGDGDARLACTACHDPHQQLVREAAAYDGKCLACHAIAPAAKTSNDHAGKRCPVGKKDCVTCHMPRVDLPNMHAPFTDHRIRIVKRGQPYPD
jgi:Cytochrome c554 and c-prime